MQGIEHQSYSSTHTKNKKHKYKKDLDWKEISKVFPAEIGQQVAIENESIYDQIHLMSIHDSA